MSAIFLNLAALAHNAEVTIRQTADWGLDLLPILKCFGSHLAARQVLRRQGLERFGFAEPGEPDLYAPDGDGPDGPDGRVLIQLTSLSKAGLVAERFKRSFQSVPETLRALDAATAALALEPHEVVLMVDLGDRREGLNKA